MIAMMLCCGGPHNSRTSSSKEAMRWMKGRAGPVHIGWFQNLKIPVFRISILQGGVNRSENDSCESLNT